MKRVKQLIRAVLCICLSLTVLMGAGLTARAAENVRSIRWNEGLEIVLQEGDVINLTSPDSNQLNWFVDGTGWGLNEIVNVSYSTGTRYLICRLSPEGVYDLFTYKNWSGESDEPDESGDAEAPSIVSGPCSHSWSEEIFKYATATEDGLTGIKCKYCGVVQEGTMHVVSGYQIFNKEAAKTIRDAKTGEVTIETRIWVSFGKEVFDAMEARPDVTVKLNYVNEHKEYTLTIPAGTKGEGLLDQNGFCGFRNLASSFPGSEVAK